ncbi:hypothetical protein HOC01_00935 [archaeon]|nr:hypothetical protein [archaeon]MBT6698593.1 hypothetical protein [archaeon]
MDDKLTQKSLVAIVLIVGVIGMIISFGSSDFSATGEASRFSKLCGDGTCQAFESTRSCREDCGTGLSAGRGSFDLGLGSSVDADEEEATGITDANSNGIDDRIEAIHSDYDFSDPLDLDLMGSTGTVAKTWIDADDASWVSVSTGADGIDYITFSDSNQLTYNEEIDGDSTFDYSDWFVINAKVRTHSLDSTGVFVTKLFENDKCQRPYNEFIMRQYNGGGYQLGITTIEEGEDDTRFMTPSWYEGAGEQSNTWTYVTGVWDGSELYLYQDGELVADAKEVGRTPITTVGHLVVGNTPCRNTNFEGDMAELQIWGE